MKSFLFFSFFFLFLAACAPTEPLNGRGGDPFGDREKTSKDITDRSLCKGTSQSVPLYTKAWITKTLVYNGVILDKEIRFTPNRIEVSLTGSYHHSVKTVYVRSSIEMRSSVIEIQDRDQSDTTLFVDGDAYKISLKIEPMVLRYSFRGPCLQMRDGNQTLILVPKDL